MLSLTHAQAATRIYAVKLGLVLPCNRLQLQMGRPLPQVFMND